MTEHREDDQWDEDIHRLGEEQRETRQDMSKTREEMGALLEVV